MRSGGTWPSKVFAFAHGPTLQGGAELCTVEFLEHCLARGIEVEVAVRKDGELAQHMRALGATVHLMPARFWMSLEHAPSRRVRARRGVVTALRIVRDALGARRVVARSGADVVLTGTIASPVGALAARLARLPHVWWIMEYGDLDHGFEFLLPRRLTWRVVRAVGDRGVVMSRALQEYFSTAFAPDRLEVVDPAVDVPTVLAPHRRVPGEPLRLLQLGRLVRTKGGATAVRAVALLNQHGTRCTVEFVGPEDPEFKAELEALVGELGVADAVTFSGRVPDQMAHLDAAHAVLMSSRNEAFGRVTVEALKCGRPVVGSRSGATADLVHDGDTGLLYLPESPDDLAAQLRVLVDDPERVERMAVAAAEENRARFVPDVQHDRLLEVLGAAAARSGGRGSGRRAR